MKRMRTAQVLYRVPYADTDRLGVVYYANYLVYFERGRGQLMRDAGLPYGELERRGFALPVIEAHVAMPHRRTERIGPGTRRIRY